MSDFYRQNITIIHRKNKTQGIRREFNLYTVRNDESQLTKNESVRKNNYVRFFSFLQSCINHGVDTRMKCSHIYAPLYSSRKKENNTCISVDFTVPTKSHLAMLIKQKYRDFRFLIF